MEAHGINTRLGSNFGSGQQRLDHGCCILQIQKLNRRSTEEHSVLSMANRRKHLQASSRPFQPPTSMMSTMLSAFVLSLYASAVQTADPHMTWLPRAGYASMKKAPAARTSIKTQPPLKQACDMARQGAPLSSLWGCDGERWDAQDPQSRLLDWSFAGRWVEP